MEKLRFDVFGMTCSACSARVEKTVSALPGVKEASVSLMTNQMTVVFSSPLTADDIMRAVRDAGYKAEISDASHNKKRPNTTAVLFIRFLISLAALIPLMYVSMGHAMWGWPLPEKFAANALAVAGCELGLSLFVMIVNGKFFVNGVKGLFHRAPNMDTLVAMGSSISFFYSVALMIAAGVKGTDTHLLHGLYFESAAMIPALITLGKALESYSKGKTTSAIKGLMALAPSVVCVLKDGNEETVPLDELKTGDLFITRPGENFAADGVIVSGDCSVNEAAITGESMPVEKTAGSEIISGTVNLNGFVTAKATRVGEDSALGSIVKLVQEASASKAPIAKTADKVSAIFVPTVLIVALITFIVWIAVSKNTEASLTHAISVLVISCPCALGLATPVAIMVGNGKSAKSGILFKTAAALEETGKSNIVVFDKTGTLTKGSPAVTDITPFNGFSENDVLKLAAALEKGSEHPLAAAVLRKAEEIGLTYSPAENFTSLSGHGVKGIVDDREAVVGNLSLLRNEGADASDAEDIGKKFALEGKTPVYLAVDKKIAGIIAISDEIKEDAAEAVEGLKRQGLAVAMLTGDNAYSAEAVAKKCGIDTVFSEVLPEEKDAVVNGLKKYGRVIMVGDGINDAPALTGADTGIAIGAGTDIAIDSADVVLMRSSVSDVSRAMVLSRRTMTNIRENLFWAFIYNCVCIPVAAGAFSPLGITLNPMISAAAMSLSSLSVVLNALRLNFVNPDKIRASKNKPALPPSDEIFAKNIKSKYKGEIKMTKKINIEGMMCAHCAARVKNALSRIDGVKDVDVSVEENRATVTLSSDVSDDVFKSAVETEGYVVTSIE